jgi:SAM-dependent methyltransferase
VIALLHRLVPARLRRLVPARLKGVLRQYVDVDYHAIYASDACRLLDIRRARVLVVGCNTGGDCRQFVERGAPEVVGLDVVDDIGTEFAHDRVTYIKRSIEDSGFADGSFDLIYAVATMEHVPDVAAGFSEMARVTKPGGFIYSAAAPLWNSPYGHHMGCFQGHPWVHVNFTVGQIMQYVKVHGIGPEAPGVPIEATVEYMMDLRFFNMRPAHDYVSAVKALAGQFSRLENDVMMEDRKLLQHPLGQAAMARGYSEFELLGVTHKLVARKA